MLTAHTRLLRLSCNRFVKKKKEKKFKLEVPDSVENRIGKCVINKEVNLNLTAVVLGILGPKTGWQTLVLLVVPLRSESAVWAGAAGPSWPGPERHRWSTRLSSPGSWCSAASHCSAASKNRTKGKDKQCEKTDLWIYSLCQFVLFLLCPILWGYPYGDSFASYLNPQKKVMAHY